MEKKLIITDDMLKKDSIRQKKNIFLNQIQDLELKCLRPLRENDKEYLDKYNNQISELRKQLQDLNDQLDELNKWLKY